MASIKDQVLDQVDSKSSSSQSQVEDRSETSQSQVPDQVPVKSRKSSSSTQKDEKDGKIIKPKNPGREAAGKKLAKMNRKNKEKKTKPACDEGSRDINWGYFMGAAGLVIAGGSLYYTYKEHQKVIATPKMTNPVNAPRRETEAPSKKKLI